MLDFSGCNHLCSVNYNHKVQLAFIDIFVPEISDKKFFQTSVDFDIENSQQSFQQE